MDYNPRPNPNQQAYTGGGNSGAPGPYPRQANPMPTAGAPRAYAPGAAFQPGPMPPMGPLQSAPLQNAQPQGMMPPQYAAGYPPYGQMQIPQGQNQPLPQPMLQNPMQGMPMPPQQQPGYPPMMPQPYMEQQNPQPPYSMPEPAEVKSKKGVLNTIMNLAFYAFLVIMIGGAVIFSLSDNPEKSLMGIRPYNVLTNSMKSNRIGGFSKGDIIIVKSATPDQIDIGDVITFNPGTDKGVFLTHRVVDKMDHINGDVADWFVTRGDANDADDAPITGDVILGKVLFSIPFMGNIISYLRENIALAILIIIAGIGLMIVLQLYVRMPQRKKKAMPARVGAAYTPPTAQGKGYPYSQP